MRPERASTQPSAQERDGSELVLITELTMDYEAPIVASIFEANGVPHLIQGLESRRIIGVVGRGLVPLKLMVPYKHEEVARALIREYRDQLAQDPQAQGSQAQDSQAQDLQGGELEEGEDASYIPRRRVFTRRGGRAGVALLLGGIIGYGTASLFAGLYVAAVPIALIQLTLLAAHQGFSAAATLLNDCAALMSLSTQELSALLTLTLIPLDVVLSILWIYLRPSQGGESVY